MNPEDFSPELGALVHLDHVNLRVPDHHLATLFFIEGLGLTRDPYRMTGTGNMWVNVGQEQFHLPLGNPTPFPGVIHLTVPEPKRIAGQLAAIAPRLEGTEFAFREENGALCTATPWGHTLQLQEPEHQPFIAPLALRAVTFPVPPGSADAIGEFYATRLHSPVVLSGDEGVRIAAVTAGPHQQLCFQEQPDATPIRCRNHIAVYLTRYQEVYRTLHESGLVTEGHGNEQFRFEDIATPGGKAPLFSIEHEVRSLYHSDYRRPLVNREGFPPAGL